MENFLTKMTELLGLLAPNPFVQGLAGLGLAYFIAKIADWILTRLLKGIANSTKNEFDDKFVELFHKPVVATVMLIGFDRAVLLFGLPDNILWILSASAWTIIIVYWMVFSIKFTRLSLTSMSKKENHFKMVQMHTLPLFNNFAMIMFFGLATYFIFLAWEINVSAWIASAGILGLALSFAAKDTLANLFAGVFILADSPYSLGHYIILETGERGMVTHIGIRSTRILTRDDVEITIPNAIMGNSKIINETSGINSKMRIRIKVSVAYGTDTDKVREILMNTVKDHTDIVMDPEPRVRFRHFGDSGLEFELLCWVGMPVLRGKAIDSINESVYKAFLREEIEIPYPKRDLYIKEMKGQDK